MLTSSSFKVVCQIMRGSVFQCFMHTTLLTALSHRFIRNSLQLSLKHLCFTLVRRFKKLNCFYIHFIYRHKEFFYIFDRVKYCVYKIKYLCEIMYLQYNKPQKSNRLLVYFFKKCVLFFNICVALPTYAEQYFIHRRTKCTII